MGAALAVFTVALFAPRAHGAGAEGSAPTPGFSQTAQDLCPGSAPEPTQSAIWSVAFCNRTGHDVVLEFHDNDCPAKDWSRRGDIYQRMLHKGESQTFPLCYASEPAGKKLAPGVPTLRIPGGRGVVTTWSVVGDCGERSRPLNVDGRTFYDRGEYKTGIVLLQHPAGAAHCAADVSAAPSSASPLASAAESPAASSAGGVGTSGSAGASGTAGAHGPTAVSGSTSISRLSTSGTSASEQAAGQPSTPVAPHSPVAAPAAASTAAVNPRGSGAPTLSVAVDQKDIISRTVRVFAKDGAGYKCSFNLAVTFTDGASWNDHGSVDITAGDADAPVATRKYLKSVSKAQVTSSKCAPM